MTEVEATIAGAVIGGGLGLISALAGAYYGVRYQSKRAAQQLFSDTIHEILQDFYPDPSTWPKNSYELLQSTKSAVKLAVAKLQFHLNQKEIKRINTALAKYCEWCNQINDAQIVANKMYKKSMPSIDQKAVFKRHVEALITASQKA
jgi:gas vesicle protein